MRSRRRLELAFVLKVIWQAILTSVRYIGGPKVRWSGTRKGKGSGGLPEEGLAVLG